MVLMNPGQWLEANGVRVMSVGMREKGAMEGWQYMDLTGLAVGVREWGDLGDWWAAMLPTEIGAQEEKEAQDTTVPCEAARCCTCGTAWCCRPPQQMGGLTPGERSAGDPGRESPNATALETNPQDRRDCPRSL